MPQYFLIIIFWPTIYFFSLFPTLFFSSSVFKPYCSVIIYSIEFFTNLTFLLLCLLFFGPLAIFILSLSLHPPLLRPVLIVRTSYSVDSLLESLSNTDCTDWLFTWSARSSLGNGRFLATYEVLSPLRDCCLFWLRLWLTLLLLLLVGLYDSLTILCNRRRHLLCSLS